MVEVAVVHVALPVDRHQVAAHHRRQVFLPMRSAEQLHVRRELPLRYQRRAEALDRHVGERVEPVESHAMALAELALVVGFELVLRRGQRRALGVIDEVQYKIVAVAQRVQLAQRRDAALVDAAAALAIDQLGRIAGQRRDDLDARSGEEAREVRLSRLLQDGEVAAVDDMFAKPARARHEAAELGMQLRRAARDIQRLDLRQECDHVVDHLRRHHLRALRPGIDVAVHAALVAAIAEVHLQDLEALAPHGREAVLAQQGKRGVHYKRCGGALPACCSSSRPSSRCVVARRRCDSISTSSIRILAPSSGCSTMMRARLSRSSTAIMVASAATQVAKRAWPSIIDISPSVRPASTVARSCGVFQRSRLCTSTLPWTSISMKSPPSPSRMISMVLSARYMSMKCASVLTSPSEKCSSRVHFGISAWIWPANLVASPRYSRCASCCGRCGMGSADYAKACRFGSLATVGASPPRRACPAALSNRPSRGRAR